LGEIHREYHGDCVSPTLPRYLFPTSCHQYNTGGLTSRRSPGVVEWILPHSCVQFQANGATSVRRFRGNVVSPLLALRANDEFFTQSSPTSLHLYTTSR